tara:strand:- start:473 stop:694 length:222 start_codon:yes stop_codon:yes gene_type:complete
MEDVTDLTWEQLEVVTSCVSDYRNLQLEIALEVISGALGGKKSKSKRAKSNQPQNKMSTADKFAALGIPISNS